MATTYNNALTERSTERSAPGLASRWFQRYVDSRQQEANRLVGDYLRTLDNEMLTDLGYTEAQITALRRQKSRSGFSL